LTRLDRVELFAARPNLSATHRLVTWLASDESLRHVRWQHGTERVGGIRPHAGEVPT
jgi:hypothetical protein